LQVPDDDAAAYLAAGLNPKLAKLYGMLANLDWNVGRILDALDAAGIANDTLVIFMTDNGAQQMDKGIERFNAGLRDWKGSVYDGGIRVPFFVRWPGGFAGNRDADRIAMTIDLAPTLLDIAGAAKEGRPAFDGVSLLPLLTGAAGADIWPDRTLFTQWHRGDAPEPFRNCAVRTQRWKLVNGAELYDMPADPAEARDVAKENPEVIQQLRAAYEKWFADVGATRGYAPVRVHVGNAHQNPVTFSRQDWRGSEDWNADKVGYWEITVETPGEYAATITFAPENKKGTVHFKLGGFETEQPVAPKMGTVRLEGLHPNAGDTKLECWLDCGGDHQGARFVSVEKK
jgi:hypothetical protein